jgi:hypothetical protein
VRYAPFLFLSGMVTIVISCDSGTTDTSSCGADKDLCGEHCVPRGTCMDLTAVGGSTQTTTVDPGPTSSPDCTDSSTDHGTLSVQYAKETIKTASDKDYCLMTNWWGNYVDQTISYDGLSLTIGNPNNVKAPDTNPIGFPTMFIGTYSGCQTQASNLPKQVADLTTVPTIFSTNIAYGNYDSNAAYDVWFTPTAETLSPYKSGPPTGGAYLMVWLYKPGSRAPRGTPAGELRQVAGVNGSWVAWVDKTDPPCISYVATKQMNGFAFDLAYFIRDAVSHGYGITDQMYLSLVFAGFEIWSGGDGLKINNFCVNVN